MAKKRKSEGNRQACCGHFYPNSLHITRHEFSDLVEFTLQDNTQEGWKL